MDFRFTEKEEAFREEVRSFLRRELPVGWMGAPPWTGESEGGWQFAQELTKKLGKKRWLTISWPKDYGGLDGSGAEVFIFSEESAYYRAPRVDVMGTGIVGPTILVHGTEEQKKRFLLPTARGELIWCQGFTEPNAGSDSASIQTRAVEDGDDYIINGQKIFTSLAHRAHMCYLTARTDPDVPKHRGISYLLVDLKAPGVTIRPLSNMAGEHSFNEVFFDNVRVAKENLLGEKNQGWRMMVTTLDFERGTIASLMGSARRTLDDLLRYVRAMRRSGKVVDKDTIVRHKLAELAVEVEVARLFVYRVIWMQDKGIIPNYEASMAKLYNDELNFRIARTGMELLGLYGQLTKDSKWAPLEGWIQGACLGFVGSLLAGGTPEIQRNIISIRGLGLPRA